MWQFVKDVIAKGAPWTDPDFPPQLKSLYDPRIDRVDDPDMYEEFEWKRFREIYTD
jgi:hypothetical protein